MPKINIQFTQNSVHLRPEIFAHRDYETGVHTQIMPGSVTATAHHLPQVVVTANGQRAACSGNCDFAWRADHTITLDDVQGAAQLAKGDSITVIFDVKAYTGTLDNLKVLIWTSPNTNLQTLAALLRRHLALSLLQYNPHHM